MVVENIHEFSKTLLSVFFGILVLVPIALAFLLGKRLSGWRILWAVPGSVLLSMLLGWILSSLVVRPIYLNWLEENGGIYEGPIAALLLHGPKVSLLLGSVFALIVFLPLALFARRFSRRTG